MVEAAIAAGFKPTSDFNGESHLGVGLYQVTQRGGVRADTASAFLDPIRDRTNLTIVTGTQVTRIVVTDGRATGIEAIADGSPVSYTVEREVIVSAHRR